MRRPRYESSYLLVAALTVAAFLLGPQTDAGPHPELGKPWIESWSVADYPASSHQNWTVRLGPSGLIWAGNSGGVQFFDGVRWSLVKTPNSTIVYALSWGLDGRLYLGTTSDLGYLEPGPGAQWQFVSLLPQVPSTAGGALVGEPEPVPEFGDVLGVEVLDDAVFFHTRQLLFRYRPETGTLSWLRPHGTFQRMAQAGGELYVADREAGIFRFDHGGPSLVPVLPWDELGDAGAVWMGGDDRGRLLLLTEAGLGAVEEGALLPLPTEADAWLRGSQPYGLVLLSDGVLAIGSRLDGLVLLAPDGRLIRHLSRAQGLPWNWACGVVLDGQGGLWVTQDGGINRIEIDPVLTFFDEDLGVHSVQALTRFQGRLVAATTEGLKVLETSPPRLREAAVPAASQAGFVSLAAEGSQTWSLLASGEELLFGDSRGIQVLQIAEDGAVVTERVHEGRRAVHLASSPRTPGVVYAALGDGVARLRRTEEGWRSEGKVRGIDVPVVYVEQGEDGSLWAGTITGIYFRITSTSRWPEAEIETFRAEDGVPQGNAHLFRAEGELLFGTWDGFFRFTGRRFEPDGRFPEPLRDRTLDIHRMAEGPDGKLWIYAGGHLGRATKRTDGTFDWDPTLLAHLPREKVSALWVDDDGVVWAGRRSGVVRFDPSRWKPPAPMAAARVVAASVPGEPHPFYGGAVGPEAFEGTPLSPSQDALRVHFAVADFAAPRALEFRSLLEGVDARWSEWTTEARRDFTSLPPGRHLLRVEARNSQGQISPEGSFRFRRLAPWHQTWQAFFLYGLAALLLVAGTGVGVARWRTARLESERLRLQGLVEERTQEIRRQAEELAAQQRTKNRFFSNVSHELRTPLTLTLGPLEDASAGRLGALPKPLAESVGTALRNARQLRNLVDQVLDVGRLEAGQMPLAAAPGDLGVFVRRVTSRFAAAAERGGVALEVQDGEGHLEVYFDAGLLDRVVSNLLSNALKFTPAGGRISVRTKSLQGEALVEVQDTGVGIAAEDLSRVFDRYFQAGRTVAHQPGTGIGLALVKELVELHSGRVEAESAPGRGSTFRVSLPLGREHLRNDQLASASRAISGATDEAPAAEPPDEVPGSRSSEEEEPAGQDATTLLLVEDNAELRGFLRRRFAGRYRVLEAEDGAEALERCRKVTPDLVISDVLMPVMDGLELTRRLREDPDLDFIPILLLTARAETEDAVEGLGAGADDYLRKPFDGAELEARVERLIASRRHLRARFAAPEAVTGLTGVDAEFDRRLLGAIEERLGTDDLSVQSLADTLAMDRTHLYRRVQAVRGVSPQALILKVRLQTAAGMLALGEGSVSEVAYSVGFNSLSHFSESFRRHFGLPPSKWRRQAVSAPS